VTKRCFFGACYRKAQARDPATDLSRGVRVAGEWVATPTIGAAYLRHLLVPAVQAPPKDTRIALCGERRRKWQPVDEFARPEVFTPCPKYTRRRDTPA